MDPYLRGPDWTPITPKTGSLFHADSHSAGSPCSVEGRRIVALFADLAPGTLAHVEGAFGAKYDYGDEKRFTAETTIPR